MNLPTVRFAATLLMALTALSAAARAAPTGVALLPTVGPASEDDRRDVDAALRQALRDEDTIDLLSPVATRDNLMSLAEMGLVCVPEDVPCLVKLGIVADVAWVLVPEVEKPTGSGTNRTIRIAVGVIDVATAARARVVDEEVTLADAEAIGSLARRAMGLSATAGDGGTGTPDGNGGSGTGGGSGGSGGGGGTGGNGDNGGGGGGGNGGNGGNGGGNGATDPTAPPSPGLLLAGIGGVVAGVSLVGAIVSDLVFLNVINADKDTRENMVPVGAVLWGTTAVGAITAGVGAYLLSEEANAADVPE